MDAFAAPYFGLPREAKFGHYRAQPLSSLSSPSATSSSSGDDDLLPELWLEGTAQPTPQTESAPFARQYTYSHPAVADSHSGAGPMSAPMFHDDSLAYAQSLLPHSLLFPLEDTFDNTRSFAEPAYKYDLNFASSIGQSTLPSVSSTGSSSPLNVSQTNLRSPQSHHSQVHSPVQPQLPAFKSRSNSYSDKQRHDSVCSTGSCGSTKCQKSLNTQLYKTELCASFIKMGSCPYGGKCQFAHGEHELKTVERPSNWRSKPCANWARHGSCRYGKRCCFKHGD